MSVKHVKKKGRIKLEGKSVFESMRQ